MNPYLDGRPAPSRPGSRFLVFGIAAILAIGGLTTRLFYLQIVSGGQFAALTQVNREVSQSIPSSRGLIFDRAGRPLVTNVLTYAVKIRPVDLPETRRDEVVLRLSTLLKMNIGDINATIDGNPGSSFDLVRIATDVPEATAQLIAESADSLPGVEVETEARRQYPEGTLVSQLLGYTGPVSAGQLETLSKQGYLPDDLVGKAGIEAYYETQLRGIYGSETVQRDASGRKLQVLETTQQAQAGDSLRLTIDVKEQQYAQKALQWGMRAAGLKRGVVIVMNPQTGEVLAMVSLPTYDDNAFAKGISVKDYNKLLHDKNKPLLNHAVQAHYPPGSTYKLVGGSGRAGGRQDHRHERSCTRGRTSSSAGRSSGNGTTAASGLHPDQGRLRPLERHVLLPDRGHARDRAARPLGPRSTVSASRPGSICPARWPGSCRTMPGSRSVFGEQIYPGRDRTRPGSARATTS